jgi:hypothetical protein
VRGFVQQYRRASKSRIEKHLWHSTLLSTSSSIPGNQIEITAHDVIIAAITTTTPRR